MKSPLKKSIGEVVTDYGTKVMRILKKRLQRSLFDFYGDVKADNLRTRETINPPTTPVDGDGGVIYTKSADGKLYYKSNEVSEVELSSSGSTLTTEQVQDIVGAMFSSNTETNITATYEDSDGTIDLVATDTNTQLSTEQVQDIVGAMFTGNTETRISATYEDSDGTIDLVVNDIPVDLTVSGDGTIHADNVPTLNQNTTGNAATATALTSGNKIIQGDLELQGNLLFSQTDGGPQSIHDAQDNAVITIADDGLTTLLAAGDLDIGNHDFRAKSFTSDVATGTAPFTVSSTTEVANLNAATATNLTSGDKTLNGIITSKGLVVDDNRSVTPSVDGVAIHVDAMDVTDSSTSASGTASTYNHITFENPRLFATNASVTTTDAATVFIKGAPFPSTNQTITNNYALKINSGDSYFAGDIIAANNTIKDSGGNTIISSDGSGVVTMAGGNIVIGGSNAKINLNAGSDVVLEADNAGGSLSSSIQYVDAAGTNRIMLGADSNAVVLANRASNGTVQIRANTSTAGGSGEVTVVTVQDNQVDISQNLNVTGTITGKQYQVFPTNFIDDIGTSEVFLPIHGTTFEQSLVYQDDVALVAPCDGRVVSVTLSIMSVTGTSDVNVRVYSRAPDNSGTSLANWTLEETEEVNITSSDDNHVVHFGFSNAKHFESTEKFAISIQADSDIMSNTFIYATTVIEWDYSTLLGASAKYDSVP